MWTYSIITNTFNTNTKYIQRKRTYRRLTDGNFFIFTFFSLFSFLFLRFFLYFFSFCRWNNECFRKQWTSTTESVNSQSNEKMYKLLMPIADERNQLGNVKQAYIEYEMWEFLLNYHHLNAIIVHRHVNISFGFDECTTGDFNRLNALIFIFWIKFTHIIFITFHNSIITNNGLNTFQRFNNN